MINFLAIIQARINSNRLHNKVLLEFNGVKLINIIIKNLKKSKYIDKVVVATGDKILNEDLIKAVKKNKNECFIGDEYDVLSRYYKCAKKYKAKNIVRITGDCPFIDGEIVDNLIKIYNKNNADYASNTLQPTFPDGMDAEIFNFISLEKANKFSRKKNYREHVTPYIIKKSNFKKVNYLLKKDYSNYRITLDNYDDLVRINNIFTKFKNKKNTNYKNILKYIEANPSIFKVKSSIRNLGSKTINGQKLWERAKQIIPG